MSTAAAPQTEGSQQPPPEGAERVRPPFDCEYKVIIIGDAGAGKSSFFHQFREGKFPKQIMQTIGVEFGTKIITLQNEDRRVKLNVWDTAGQERYRAVTRAYYRGAKGAVILFDVTSSESYNHLPDWLQDAREQAVNDIDIIVVGNKMDLADRRQVAFREANAWASSSGVLFMETSALTGENVQEVFQILTQHIQARADKAADRVSKETEVQGQQLQNPSVGGPARSCCGG
jgi:small GTP-binding protein